ncbi:MAG: carbohydrate binding domain-containing protein [Bacteroidales bacterium]|nr:carbohydrate binding domain-containing protein [Bacteroidales bacterium]
MIHKHRFLLTFIACTFSLSMLNAQPVVHVNTDKPGATVSPRLYGIFFEEINHAGDGGLYAELIQNRSFEDDAERPVHWRTFGGAQASLATDGMLNEHQAHALRLTVGTAGGGLINDGYWGMNFRQQTTYTFSAWIKADEAFKGNMTVALTGRDGRNLGQTSVPLKLKAGKWTQLKDVRVLATGSDAEGRAELTFSAPGAFTLDVVSLFPPTYKGRTNGCRIDLAEMLEDLHPKFMRFPGGCYVEGQTTPRNNLHNRFVWKNTIGPIEQRPGHLSVNWGYNITDGFGYHEMLQLAEDLGAEPLFVVNVGLGHGWMQPYDQIEEYIQEALDAIEYANGDAKTTKWGAQRAQNGHPEPFGLRLLEVGNENANFYFDSNRDQSDHYFERYIQFYKAIKAKYPEIEVIGNVESWGTDEPSWRSNHPVDLLDEHYYRSPSWFEKNFNKYDVYDRNGPKIYVGEYAVTQGYGVNGHLTAALGEAIYMQGLERNSDIVVMGSYAPIFVNEHNPAWRPDMIRFNASESFGTPSYHVQKMMANNVGTRIIPVDVSGNTLQPTIGHHMGFSTWGTKAEFRNLEVKDADGNVILNDDFSTNSGKWTGFGGETNGYRRSQSQWTFEDGTLKQQNQRAEGSVLLNTTNLGDEYIIHVQARRMEGNEGFIICFGAEDDENLIWWNLGGWGNSQHAIEHMADGGKNTLAAAQGKLEEGRWYDVEIQVKGASARCLLDGQLIHEFSLPERQSLYANATLDEKTNELILKLVNPTSASQVSHINLGCTSAGQGRAIVLTSAKGSDENTMRQQLNVSPVEIPIRIENGAQALDYPVQPFSLNILRLKVQ